MKAQENTFVSDTELYEYVIRTSEVITVKAQVRILSLAAQLRDTFVGEPLDSPLLVDLSTYQTIVSGMYERSSIIDYRVLASYATFIEQCAQQFRAMIFAGFTVEFCDYDPTPINPATGGPSYVRLVREVEASGILRIYRSTSGHPILDCDGMNVGGRIETYNSIFRAVHDFYGHLASGGYFNWIGETAAYYSHARMFSADARAALFSETVAQQCYYAVHRDYAAQKCMYAHSAFHNPPLT